MAFGIRPLPLNLTDTLGNEWSNPSVATNLTRQLTAAVVATTVLAFSPFVTAVIETVTVDKWFHELSVPVKFPPALLTGLQQTTAYVNVTPSEDSIEPKWHYPWSEPVRFPPQLRTGLQTASFYASYVPIVSFGWMEQLSEPVRFPPDLRAPRQRDFFAEPFSLTQPEQILYSKFAYQWSEPVRFPLRLKTGLHQVLAFQPMPSPFAASGWYQPLTDPVRFPLRLRAGLNLFTSLPFPVVPAPTSLLEGWFNWWSEPARTLQGLKPWLQQTTAMPPRLLPVPFITGVFHAEESFDTFAASGTMFGQVQSAGVGIIDIFPSSAAAGVIDTTPLSANVGQVATPTATASGTVVVPSTAANVSIKVV